MVTLQRLATWGLRLEPSLEALAHELTTRRCEFLLRKFLFIICFDQTLTLFFTRIATIKENKGKGLVDDVTLLETQSQPCPSVGDKRKSLSKTLDLENLPSCRGNKNAKHGSSNPGVIKSGSIIPPTSQQPSIQIHDLDSPIPTGVTPSKPIVTTSSQPSGRIPMNLLENEDLAWERF